MVWIRTVSWVSKLSSAYAEEGIELNVIEAARRTDMILAEMGFFIYSLILNEVLVCHILLIKDIYYYNIIYICYMPVNIPVSHAFFIFLPYRMKSLVIV